MMNLKAVVRLIDQTARPARDAAGNITHLGDAATRAMPRLNRYAEAVGRALGAMRAVTSTTTATAAETCTGRLRGAGI